MKGVSVSVIIPVFNGERYISDTLNSLAAQTFRDFEVIVVDDGSTDSGGDIIRSLLPHFDPSLRYIKKNQGGVSSARNLGIDKAIGRYICFIDGDDLVSEYFLEHLFNSIEKYEADIALCSYTRSLKDLSRERLPSSLVVMEKGDLISNIAYKTRKNYSCCNLYKTSVIRAYNLYFTLGCRYGEDREFLWKYSLASESGIFICEHLYFYRDNDTSVVNTTKWEMVHDIDAELRIHKLISRDPSLESYLECSSHRLTLALNNVLRQFLRGDRNLLIRFLSDETYSSLLLTNSLNFKQALRNRLAVLSPRFFCLIMTLRRSMALF